MKWVNEPKNLTSEKDAAFSICYMNAGCIIDGIERYLCFIDIYSKKNNI